MRPVGIDIFAGAGGMSLGFEQAGFDIAAAVEIDPVHAAVHHFNFPECTVIPRSILDLRGEYIRDMARLKSKPIDVVFGGAPCQGFSMIGQRSLDDPRNALVREFARIVRELDASYFVFENVKGITVGRHRRFLEEVIAEFRDNGYRVQLPWEVLNAADYDVPQNRQRLILYGAREGLALPTYPNKSLNGAPTCGEALSDLPEAEDYPELFGSDKVLSDDWGFPTNGFARRMRCIDNESWHLGRPRAWNPAVLTSSARTKHTAISRRRFAETPPGEVEPVSRFYRLAESGQSNTLRAGTDSARGAFTSPRPIHYKKARCITVREMARLHGFPDWFRFHETKWHGARQIGNAVPPPLARAIAKQVVEVLGVSPSVPALPINLGSEALLKMDITAASTYWGIENPIRGRDRKSGARKRKQTDIEQERIDAARP